MIERCEHLSPLANCADCLIEKLTRERDEARALLVESKREHQRHCDSNYESVCGDSQRCDCGADAWNTRVAAFLARTEGK